MTEISPRPSPKPVVQDRPTSMPPGWYPGEDGVNRWWSGVEWTDHVGPVQQMPPVVAARPVPHQMVTRTHKRTGHGLHLFLTIITGGLWGFVWAWQTFWHRSHKGDKTVTTVGYGS